MRIRNIITAMIGLLLTVAFIASAGAAPITMAAMFITTSITWEGKQNMDYFIKPMFIGLSPFETKGVRVIPNIQSKQKLNYFGAGSKILKAYAKGFSAASGVTLTQREIEVYRMKAEAADDASAFYQTVFEQGLNKADWNDLGPTQLKNIIIEIYRDAVRSDVFRQFWLNKTEKETVSGGTYTGTADADYNSFDGIWQMILENAATSPSSTQIKRVTYTTAAAAQVDTLTFTGTSGTADVTVNGVEYLATFDTDLATTASNFQAAHAAALAARDITLTYPGSGDAVVFTSAIPGQPFAAVSIANATGDLAGSRAATTANTAPDALSAGESEDIFLGLWEGAPKVLKQIPKKGKVLLVTTTILDNYITYLESLGTEAANKLLVDGQEFYTYRGIPIIDMGWDEHLDADFAHASGSLPAYPHRVIYTALGNLVLGLDAANNYNKTEMWYNKDEEENRFRTKLIMGAQYVHHELMAVTY
jgi:hypothetical protein